jgi:hypothetical protein
MAALTTRRRFVLGAAVAPLLARRSLAQAGFPSRTIASSSAFRPAAASTSWRGSSHPKCRSGSASR